MLEWCNHCINGIHEETTETRDTRHEQAPASEQLALGLVVQTHQGDKSRAGSSQLNCMIPSTVAAKGAFPGTISSEEATLQFSLTHVPTHPQLRRALPISKG